LAEKKGLLKKDGNRLAYTTLDGEIIKYFRKGWESNENGCLDVVMAEFGKRKDEVSIVETQEEVE
jgi:hypothetical protein